jgi:predicted porin
LPNSEGKATKVALACDYPLSKRTGVYVSYGRVGNNDNARASLFSTTQAVFANGDGASVRATSLGIRHSF